MLAYYANIIIALDYDSFSLNGGQKYFMIAQNIVNAAQNNSISTGWKPFGTTINRYWFIENNLNNRYRFLREVAYEYHREGLDVMYDDVFGGREAIVNTLEKIERVHNESPNSMAMKLFFNAKADEMVKILQQASPIEKTKAVTILTKVDASNGNKYQKIMQSGGKFGR